ncbi:alpha/beta hydrolase [Liquorilactobacillus satsumensis]|uniref:alpha/beta hydrolase n=1 Tax=Liquorilactobacillus satsumensis TaxID=259059 RepID=UPI001E4FDC82|nr:alpha/beta hydrolase [Liquorilactobacillus satsumensis]MCC7667510.1 alpha/beta hydrolase [Liquorilactobacillus satsumensis]MCP9357041.1 alpha/beta hydrolase [Liquorilactobacillus satsumensis]MCP9370988.1 alpha/beta hydrolase [Liquorilactobacillus satsumensis]
MKKKSKRIIVGGLIIVCLLLAGTITAASAYFYYFAFEPQKPLNGKLPRKKQVRLAADQRWLKNESQQVWTETAATQKLKLKAFYLPAEHSSKQTIIVAHGYQENHRLMASYIRMLHNQGYNVLAPDDRGAGQSQGSYIGFGWPDRLDYLKWIELLIKRQGQEVQIGLFGVSMGAATVMMTSGEKLPRQVKAIIADSGYSSITAELAYELKARFGLPKEPLITTAGWYSLLKNGFNFNDGNTVRQLHKNQLPLFLIHGQADKFVPTRMVYQNYTSTRGIRRLWVVPKTGHAMAYYNYPKEYTQKVETFFKEYLK